MASSEVRDTGAQKADRSSADGDAKAPLPVAGRPEDDGFGGRSIASRIVGAADRDRILKEARDFDFPSALRGYDRAAVDRYVERVTRLITELEMSSSPESAVRHALDEVSDETRDILQRAHQTADEITARSRAKADDRLKQAEREAQDMLQAAQHEAQETREAAHRDAQKVRETTTAEAQKIRDVSQREADELRDVSRREADELRETTTHEMAELREAAARESHQLRTTAQRDSDELRRSARREADEMLQSAEARARDLARNAEAIWRERRRLIDDVRAVGDQLVTLGEVEGKRFAQPAEELAIGVESGGGGDPPGTDQAAAPKADAR